MRTTTTLVAALMLAGCGNPAPPSTPADKGHGGHDAHGHGKHGDHAGHRPAMTVLEIKSAGEPAAGQPAVLRLAIPGGDGKPVREFATVHDARVHLIVVREGLDRFAHLHPEVNAETGELTARYTFPVGGTYYLFADYQPVGKSPATAIAHLAVGGDKPAAPPLAPNAPGIVRGDGLTAKVTFEGVKAGGEGTVRFEIADEGGTPVTDLEPYMGAMGHLVVVSGDATRYVHAHPAAGPEPGKNVVTFAAHFPAPGLYKGWGQFKRAGTVRVIPFVLTVE